MIHREDGHHDSPNLTLAGYLMGTGVISGVENGILHVRIVRTPRDLCDPQPEGWAAERYELWRGSQWF